MLTLSAVIVGAAALLGILLAALQPVLRRAAGPAWLPGAVHGLVGAAGLGMLIAALQGPPRGVAMGAGSFGAIAAGLLAAALLAGTILLAARLRRRQPALLMIGMHGTLAIAGFVILAAYLSMPA